MDYILRRGIEMNYDDFKKALIKNLEKYNIKINNKTIAIIFKVLCDLDIIEKIQQKKGRTNRSAKSVFSKIY
ncbi:Uncharacterised protein [uncultured Clostridium sp.]|nr:Uncharacterised protein [uncultured Clostridium sp.]